MRIYFFTLTIFYLSIPLAQCSAEDEFVDPLDMLNYDRFTMSMKKLKAKSNTEPIQNDRCMAFVSRFMNILLKNTGIQVNYTHIICMQVLCLKISKYFVCSIFFFFFTFNEVHWRCWRWSAENICFHNH